MRGLTAPLDPHEAMFLYCARASARCRLIRHLARENTSVLLSDRLRLSLYVQMKLAGLATGTVNTLIDLAAGDVRPQLTVLLDVGHTEHVRRMVTRGDRPQDPTSFELQRGLFLEAYERLDGAKVLIDTSTLEPASVHSHLLTVVDAMRSETCSDSC